MPRIRVLLDACTLVPYQLADLLLRLADANFYEPLWSDEILAEAERNIFKLGVPAEKAARRVAQMRSAFPQAVVNGYDDLSPVMRTDSKDRHVAAAAIRGAAALIVTANLKDFPPEALTPYSIQAIHPDEFLLDQLDMAPAATIACIQQHRTAPTFSAAAANTEARVANW